MTQLRTPGLKIRKLGIFGVIAILSAAIASPVFAQDAGILGPSYHGRAHEQRNDQRNFRGAYNAYDQSNDRLHATPLTNEESRNLENFGISGRDPSRVGGESPWLNPAP